MAKKTLKIADKPTLDEVRELLENMIAENTSSKNINYMDFNISSTSVGGSNTSKPSLPYKFYYGSAVVFGTIHILGGVGDNRGHQKWNGSYWTKVSTLPYDFYHGSAVVYNDEIHILGSSGTAHRRKHYKWDGTEWTKVSTLPYEFYYGSAVVLNNEIHILGGSGNQTAHYKWDGDSWSIPLYLPYNFYGGASVIYVNDIYILGGVDSTTCTNAYTIIDAQLSNFSNAEAPYMFSGDEIYCKYHLKPMNNCKLVGDHLVVQSNGFVTFRVETDQTTSFRVTIKQK